MCVAQISALALIVRGEAPTLSGHFLTIRRRAVPVVRVVVVLRARRVDVPRVVRVAGVR